MAAFSLALTFPTVHPRVQLFDFVRGFLVNCCLQFLSPWSPPPCAAKPISLKCISAYVTALSSKLRRLPTVCQIHQIPYHGFSHPLRSGLNSVHIYWVLLSPRSCPRHRNCKNEPRMLPALEKKKKEVGWSPNLQPVLLHIHAHYWRCQVGFLLFSRTFSTFSWLCLKFPHLDFQQVLFCFTIPSLWSQLWDFLSEMNASETHLCTSSCDGSWSAVHHSFASACYLSYTSIPKTDKQQKEIL